MTIFLSPGNRIREASCVSAWHGGLRFAVACATQRMLAFAPSEHACFRFVQARRRRSVQSLSLEDGHSACLQRTVWRNDC
jgi:hypothetical protein